MMREKNPDDPPYLLKPSEMEKLEMIPLAVLDPRTILPPKTKPGGKKDMSGNEANE